MIESFVPEDRRNPGGAGQALSGVRHGTAVFCDIVGFSTLSADLVRRHGRRQGAEQLYHVLDRTIGSVVALARQRGGFAVSFAGDSTTLWFDAEAIGGAEKAAAQAAAMAATLAGGGDGDGLPLRLSMASGMFDRLTLGDPAYGRLDLLAGEASLRLARMDRLSGAGRVVLCAETAALLATSSAQLSEVRGENAHELTSIGALPAVETRGAAKMASDAAINWVPLQLRGLVASMAGTEQSYAAQAEIRPISAVFILIGAGGQPDVPDRIDAFLCGLQQSLHQRGGMLLEVSTDAKGIFAPCIFGAPTAHEDGPERALAAALAALDLGRKHGVTLRIGVARGTGFSGLVAADTRTRFVTLGTAMNRAARLMERAGPGMVLTTADLTDRAMSRFEFAEVAAGSDGAGVGIWQLIRRKPAADATGPSHSDESDLVERADVLVSLSAMMEAEAGAFVLLDGAAGFGKSAILARLRQSDESQGRLWLRGRAEAQLRDVAYHAWFPVFRNLLDSAMELGLSADEMDLLGWLAGQTAEVPTALAGLSGSERSVRIGAAVGAVLASLNALQPVTLTFDDLHWADTRSLGLLLAAASGVQGLRVVAAKRLGPPRSMEAAMLFGNPAAKTVTLQGLSDEGVTALAASILGARTLSYDLGRLFLDNAGGSPRFVRLIAEVLQTRRLVRVADGHCLVIDDAEHIAKLDFLESEEAAILARFDELPEKTREAVRVASLLGRAFDLEELEAALQDRDAVAQAVPLLLASGYLVQRTGQSAVGLQFVQPVVQQALAQSVSFARRAPLNRRLARFWGERSAPGALSLRARHLLGAIDAAEQDAEALGEAITALERAAHQAAEASSNFEASELLQSAVELSQRLPDSQETLRQRLHLQAGLAFGLATFRGYGDPSVEAAYEAALALANEAENSPDLAFMIYGVFSFHASRGDYAKAMPIARRLHRLALHFRDLRLSSIAHQSRGIIAILRGRVAWGGRLVARSIEDADKIGNGLFFPHGGAGDFRIFSGTWYALALCVAGRSAEAAREWQRAADLSATNPFGRAFLRSFCALPVLEGRLEASLTEADDIVADAEARGLPLFSVIGGIYSGWAAAAQGHDDARVGRFLNASIHIAQAMGLGSFTPWFLVLAAETHLKRGDLATAEHAVSASEAVIEGSGGSLFLPEATRCRGLVALHRGDTVLAKSLFEKAEAQAASMGMDLYRNRAAGALAKLQSV